MNKRNWKKTVNIAKLHEIHAENPPNAGSANHTQRGVTAWCPYCPPWTGDHVSATRGRHIPV